MKGLKKLLGYFTRFELTLWLSSVGAILLFFLIFDRSGYLTLTASLIGATSLIFCAKGNPTGQALMLVFSALYGVISWGFAYYGEVITYLGMTAPMALLSLISWLRNPYNGKRSEVRIINVHALEIPLMLVLSILVTVVFYNILDAFGTANIIFSTLSVTSSFLAVYLSFRRNPYFALAYAANDVVLIVLWVMASISDVSYVSVAVCFAVFFINDLYGFANWLKMKSRQAEIKGQNSLEKQKVK